MRILVTGGAGFIGSHVVDLFIAEGHTVTVIDDLSSGRRENINAKARFYEGSILSPDLERILRHEKIEVVDHLAAQISVPESVKSPGKDAETNILGTINLLETSLKAGIQRFLFSSTGGAIYGDTPFYPYGEEALPDPQSPYAIAKMAAEHYIRYLCSCYSVPYVILRYANVYGPRQIPQGEAGVVSIFHERMVNAQPISLFTFPGEAEGMVRDYVYVKDVARANVLALQKGDNQTLNISTNRATRTGEIFRTLKSLPGYREEPSLEPPRPGDIPRSCLKNGRAQEVLGWKPEYELERGLKEFFDSFSNG